MKLNEQFKKRLQKLAGMDPGNKAIPNKVPSLKYDPIPGCTCPEAWNYDPDATTWEYEEGQGGTIFCHFLGCSDPTASNYNPNIPTVSVMNGGTNVPPFNDTVYCESTGENVPAWGLGVDDDYISDNEAAWPELCEYEEVGCASYPPACCLQQIHGSSIFGATLESGITVPSAEECEGMTIIGADSTPYPWPDTIWSNIEYMVNPNNTFEQGCCYALI